LPSNALSQGYENQCKQMWIFLKDFICGIKSVFQPDNQSYFLLSFKGEIPLCFAIHYYILWGQKTRNQKFSAIFKKSLVCV